MKPVESVNKEETDLLLMTRYYKDSLNGLPYEAAGNTQIANKVSAI